MQKLSSFAPISADDARVLVLGSMPGIRSLEECEYYAHPQNLFWTFIEDIFDIQRQQDYQKRLSQLKQKQIAIWDVLKHCHREGSLDSNILTETEVVNDFMTFFKMHSQLVKICFNGQKAFASFKKHVLKDQPDIEQRYELTVLPSTSPANASIPREEKLAQWKQQLLSG